MGRLEARRKKSSPTEFFVINFVATFDLPVMLSLCSFIL